MDYTNDKSTAFNFGDYSVGQRSCPGSACHLWILYLPTVHCILEAIDLARNTDLSLVALAVDRSWFGHFHPLHS